jgi:hypothetical protein
VREAGAHLETGGLGQFLLNWAHPADDWVGPLRAWLPTGCDALLVRHTSLRPREYAETWAPEGPRRQRDVERWLRWYRERGVEAIGAAFLLLRRRCDDGPPRIRALDAVTPSTPRAGLHAERILAGTDLAAHGDDALRAQRLGMVDGLRVEQTTRRRRGAWEPADARLHAVPTVGVEAAVPAELLDVVWGLDGSRPLGAVLDELPPARREAGLAVARRLLEAGFVVPP